MTQPSPASPNSLSHEAVRGTFWSYVSFASGKLLNFITTMILARLLIPEQFGLVGYCTIAIQYLDIMNTAGINNALIARKDKFEEAANAAFIINIIMGCVSFGLSWLIAPMIAGFFKEEQVTNLFRLIALVLPISGLGLVPITLIQRSLRFRARLVPDISRNIAKGITSIALALLGWGPWSLVWGQIAGEVAGVILSWILAGWRPTFKFDWQATKELAGYGSHIIIIGFAGALESNVDYIIVGRVLGAAALGIYTMAYRIPELAMRSFNEVAARVLFPLLSRMQSDGDSLRTFYFNYIRYVSLFTFSFGIGIALISKLFVELFMSSKWEPAILPMSLIALGLAISSIGYAPGVLYKSINRPEILTRIALVKLPIIAAILIICSRWGINGVAIGQVIYAIFSVSLDSFIVSRIVKFKFIELINAIAPAAFSSVIMAVTLGLIHIFFTPTGWIGFGILLLLGATSFIFTLALVSRETVFQIISTLRKEVNRSWLPHRA
jgi:O-antigen/teichoic acid export membrane protein